jgi:hypothetical protein
VDSITPVTAQKTCARCKLSFPASKEFFNSHGEGKLYPRCKPCSKLPRKSPEERFWQKVQRTKNEEECWLWTGSKARHGYGQVKHNPYRNISAHRVAYTLIFGDFAEELDVLHKCDNPPCCNPNHLFLGTAADNIRDMQEKGRANYTGPHNPATGKAIWSYKIGEEILFRR